MMDKNFESLAKELATFVNGLINIPFMSEVEEQIFFELILLKALQLIVGRTDIV